MKRHIFSLNWVATSPLLISSKKISKSILRISTTMNGRRKVAYLKESHPSIVQLQKSAQKQVKLTKLQIKHFAFFKDNFQTENIQ